MVSGMDEDDEDEDMDDGGEDSFGEDEDMIGVSDVTNQLAAAGWQHGVNFCFVNTLLLFLHCTFLQAFDFLLFIDWSTNVEQKTSQNSSFNQFYFHICLCRACK